jgi:hypothetical protein
MLVVCPYGGVLRHRCNFIPEGSGVLGCYTMLLLNMSEEYSNFNFR